MYFERVGDHLDPVSLEQAAALLPGTQPSTREWLAAHLRVPDNLLCVGREGGEVLALSVAAIVRRSDMAAVVLQELCISPQRRSCGLGEELLRFTLRSGAQAGAGIAIASKPLAETGADFLIKQGFANLNGELRRPISLAD